MDQQLEGALRPCRLDQGSGVVGIGHIAGNGGNRGGAVGLQQPSSFLDPAAGVDGQRPTR